MDTRFLKDFLSLARQISLVFDEGGCILEVEGRLSPDGRGDAEAFRNQVFWDLLVDAQERKRVRETLDTLQAGVKDSLRQEIGFSVSLALPDQSRFMTSARATYRSDDKLYLMVLERPRETAAESEHFVEHTLLNAIIETTPSVIVAKDVDGRCILANRKFRQIFNLTREQVLGRTAHDLFPPHVADNLRTNDLRVIRTAKHETSFETVRHADGEFYRYFSEKFPLLNARGEVVGTATISTDMTALQAAEKRVQEKQELLENILDNMPVLIAGKTVRDDFQLVMWNKDAERFFGIPREEAIGKSEFELFPSDRAEASRRQDLETIERSVPVDVSENQVETASGTRWLHTMKHCIRDDQSNPVLLLTVSVDITERKRQEKRFQEQNIKLLSAAKMASLGEMSSGVAHEINNPLMIIQGWANHLHSKLREGKVDLAAALKMTDTIVRNCDRIARIVIALRAFARDGEKDALMPAFVQSIITDALALCGSRFETNGVKLTVSPIDPAWSIECRAIQISQVLMNLFGNAFDALREAPSDHQWVTVEVTPRDEFIEFAVTDGGPGIPAEILDKIFQPFFTTKPINQGTGLGLSISMGIAQAHGGSLTVDTQSPHTRFVLRLPMHRPPRAPTS